MPRSLRPAAMDRSDVAPAACSSAIIGIRSGHTVVGTLPNGRYGCLAHKVRTTPARGKKPVMS
jgi:hypothetical protein